MTKEEKIKEVMELVAIYSDTELAHVEFGTKTESDVLDAERAIESKLRELIQ